MIPIYIYIYICLNNCPNNCLLLDFILETHLLSVSHSDTYRLHYLPTSPTSLSPLNIQKYSYIIFYRETQMFYVMFSASYPCAWTIYSVAQVHTHCPVLGTRYVAVKGNTCMFISKEPQGRLWCYLDHVDSIPPPQRPDSTLLHHVTETRDECEPLVLHRRHLITQTVNKYENSKQI